MSNRSKWTTGGAVLLIVAILAVGAMYQQGIFGGSNENPKPPTPEGEGETDPPAPVTSDTNPEKPDAEAEKPAPPQVAQLRPWDETPATIAALHSHSLGYRILADDEIISPESIVAAGLASSVADVNSELMAGVLDYHPARWEPQTAHVVVPFEFMSTAYHAARNSMSGWNGKPVLTEQRPGWVCFRLVNDPNLTHENPYRLEGTDVPLPHTEVINNRLTVVIPGYKHPDAPAQPKALWELWAVPNSP